MILYVKLLKKSTIIRHNDDKGQLNGEFVSYLNGKIYTQCFFLHGLKNGRIRVFFDNGQLKSEAFYKKDKLFGPERVFYPNGRLNYSNEWEDDKNVGSTYHYFQDGRLANYDTFDAGQLIFYAGYNGQDHLTQILGKTLSSHIYGISKDSTCNLTDTFKAINLTGIKFIAASPPSLRRELLVKVNDTIINSVSSKKRNIYK